MTRLNSSACDFPARRVFCWISGLAILFAAPDTGFSQTINTKVVKFLTSNTGKRIGGGESTDAVTECFRTAGGAFTKNDLDADYPDQDDRMWGTPIKVLSYKNNELANSSPYDDVLPGDILQYKGTKFVHVTNSGRKTTTTTVSAVHHTSVVAQVNPKTKLPVKVYEQNGPAAPNVDARQIRLNPIDFNALRAGWVFIYRPRSRVDEPLKYQISIVNNTSATKVPTLQSGLRTVARVPLDPSYTAASYTTVWANATTKKMGLSLVLPNGESITVTNAASYEIYKRPNGPIAIRLVTP